MNVSPQTNLDAEIEEFVINDDERRNVFIEVIQQSLRVSQRVHLYNWLQAGFQYLLGHEVMIYGIKTHETENYEFSYFSSSRYFGEAQFNECINQDYGLVTKLLAAWRKNAIPILINNDLKPCEYGNFSVQNYDNDALVQSEMKSLIVHGFGDSRSKVSTFVALARLPKAIDVNCANYFEMLMPQLHCVLVRVSGSRNVEALNTNKISKKITRRESEILQYIHMGKTNWEISIILDISALTVKNHVQNILRKLDVQNRGQAAIKASKLGLVTLLK